MAAELAAAMGLDRAPAARVPVNALIGAYAAREVARQAVDRIAEGFTTLKLKSDGDLRRDVQRLKAVRQAVGDGPELRLDANASWETASVIEHLRAVSRFRVEYVEQPVANRSWAAAAALRAKSPVPIALDESVVDERAARAIVASGAADVLILKPQRLGGPDRTVRVLEHARAHDVPCVVTNSLETGVGRAAALEAASLLPAPMKPCGLATGDHLARDTVPHPPRADHGWIARTGGPGLGVVPEASMAPPVALGGP
jgi:o-succinylbenzoate synthase